MPEIDADIRARARQMVAADIDSVRRMLGPDVGVTDAQRVSRALEVFLQTGRHITEFQNTPRVGGFLKQAKLILINPPTDVLRARIATRIPKMMRGGALDEARCIIDNNLDPSRAIGAVQLVDFLRGKIDMDACTENWINKTAQYAKRQRTWFRTQIKPDITIDRVPGGEYIDLVLSD